MEAGTPLQTYAGYGAGAEATIHSMRSIFDQDENDGVILVDATNAFNCMNRKLALHNKSILCPSVATYIRNTYSSPSRLFISGHGEILSAEGTTQGDPLSMPWFSINTSPLIEYLLAKVS